jgi:hypothetical protein
MHVIIEHNLKHHYKVVSKLPTYVDIKNNLK